MTGDLDVGCAGDVGARLASPGLRNSRPPSRRIAPGQGRASPLPWVRRDGAPSLRSTGKPAIHTMLQVRSNPVPGGKHMYVTLAALDCRAPIRPAYRKCGGARKDGARRRDVGGTGDVGRTGDVGGTGDVGRTGIRRARRGTPPRRLRAAPLHRGDKDEGFGRGNVHPPQPTSKPP
jgi:hypothetical protein